MSAIVTGIIAVDRPGLASFLRLRVINRGVVTNLIIVGGAEGARIRGAISL